MQDNDLGAAIIEGACNPEAKSLAIDLAEIGLDGLLSEGVLKHIPFLKTIVACRKTWEAIHDQLFLRKVAGFVVADPTFTEAEKTTFLNTALTNPIASKQLGDALVLILDKLDDLEKPTMLKKVFAAYVRGHIHYADFRRLSAGINAAFVGDLKAMLVRPAPAEANSDGFWALLEPAGFAHTGGGVSRLKTSIGTKTDISRLGRLFQKCMWEEQ
jgi:hypothetical protein